MKPYHLSEEEIAQAAEAMLQDDYQSLPESVSQHLKNCEECANEVLTICSILDDNQANTESKEIVHPAKQASNTKITFFYWAFAASFLLLASLYFWNHQDDPGKRTISDNKQHATNSQIDTLTSLHLDSSQTSPIETNIESNRTNLLAFQENPELEKLFARFNQSSFRADGPEIFTSGLLTFSPSDTIHLSWDAEDIEYQIQIKNYEGITVLENKTTAGSFILTMPAGLYYWKLFDEEFNLLYCGKIIIQ